MREPAALPLSPLNTVRGRYQTGLASRSSPSVASLAKGGGRPVRLANHTPAVCALKRRFCDNGTDRVREGELPRILKINFTQRKHHSDGRYNDDEGYKRQISCVDLFFVRGASLRWQV